MESELFFSVISIITLLIITSFSYLLAKRINIPYTIFFLLIGIIVYFLKTNIEFFSYLIGFELTGDMVFYIFLPILIFESAYNSEFKKIMNDIIPIFGLAVFGLIISMFFIAFGLDISLGLFGIEIPIIMLFLFGALISATDPVAVIAIFKEIGVPKRLTYIFEGESIMNDATAVAMFLVVIGIIQSGVFDGGSIGIGTLIFLGMLIFGILYGALVGFLFSKSIQYIKDPIIELTLIILLSHITFISSEMISHFFKHLGTHGSELWLFFQISPIIATTISAMILGNYGKYKMSNEIREIGNHFYEYFAFIVNSLIFVLMGILIGEFLPKIIENYYLMLLIILIVMIGRVVSVYTTILPINFFSKKEDRIHGSYSILLSYGSLRGAIAITMILITDKNLSIPGWNSEALGFTPYEFLAISTASCILFTIFVKGMTIKPIVNYFKLKELSETEKYISCQAMDFVDRKMLSLIENLKSKPYNSKESLDIMLNSYLEDDKNQCKILENSKLDNETFKGIIALYTLGIEKKTIIDAFENKEVDELSLKIILGKIEDQLNRLEKGLPQTKEKEEKIKNKNIFQKIKNLINHSFKEENYIKHKFLFYRAREITAHYVIIELQSLKSEFYKLRFTNIDEVINQYKKWYEDAHNKKLKIFEDNESLLKHTEKNIIKNHIIYKENLVLDDLYEKNIISSKLNNKLKKEFIDIKKSGGDFSF